jgi:2-C-methyl-D-erythritol 4-phosphate cytidylyltransferase
MSVIAFVTVADQVTDAQLALAPVQGEPLLTHTVRGLLGTPEVGLVVVAAPERCVGPFTEALSGLRCRVVPGLVRDALSSAEIPPGSIILVHDALRAFTPAVTIRDVIAAVSDGAQVAVPVLPMSDTVKVTKAGFITGTKDRSRLATAQTPIGYSREAFLAAAEPGLADAVASGAATVPGHPDAMRVTSGFELSLAEAIAAAPSTEEAL